MKVEAKQNSYPNGVAAKWLAHYQARRPAGHSDGEELIREWSGRNAGSCSARPCNTPVRSASQAEYEHRKHIYQRRVALLFDTGYQLPDAEHKELKVAVENALIDLEVARVELDSQTAMPVQAVRKNHPSA
jgi:hypothetical protein